ncbi:hypothetical protein [Phyllobacterium salinisoli]|uniref:hypothetical protein n=1 Tax=Phyllobacterium salinisoli TaxID=1899321 RepID=UPI0011C05472|nr:hypothetical protein [Phyllobacterium salinisoli]
MAEFITECQRELFVFGVREAEAWFIAGSIVGFLLGFLATVVGGYTIEAGMSENWQWMIRITTGALGFIVSF